MVVTEDGSVCVYVAAEKSVSHMQSCWIRQFIVTTGLRIVQQQKRAIEQPCSQKGLEDDQHKQQKQQ